MTSPTTTEELRELKRLAEAATDGKWIYNAGEDDPVVCLDVFDRMTGVQALIAEVEFGVDAAFIAAANPQTVLALLGRIEELEADRVRAVELGSSYVSDCIAKDSAIATLNAQVSQLEEALGWFLEDERFHVAVGGNPNVVERMLNDAREALRRARTAGDGE